MIKTLILLRHGQYTKDPGERLTSLGRRQANLAGKRLSEYKIDKVVVSSMPRAIETSKIALKKIPKKFKPEICDFLRECIPGFPKPLRKKYGYTDVRDLKRDQKQADQAFAKYFGFTKRKRTELLVCHGNIIRYLVCKSLGIDTDAWTKFDIKQCGITIISVNSKNKSISVVTHNDVGHMPLKMQTFI